MSYLFFRAATRDTQTTKEKQHGDTQKKVDNGAVLWHFVTTAPFLVHFLWKNPFHNNILHYRFEFFYIFNVFLLCEMFLTWRIVVFWCLALFLLFPLKKNKCKFSLKNCVLLYCVFASKRTKSHFLIFLANFSLLIIVLNRSTL